MTQPTYCQYNELFLKTKGKKDVSPRCLRLGAAAENQSCAPPSTENTILYLMYIWYGVVLLMDSVPALKGSVKVF